MVEKETRKIGRKTAKDMLTWGHYQFKQRLKWKSRYLNREDSIIDVTEEYTTKTCGNCGLINDHVVKQEVFDCKSCGLRADRDIHAARNILMKTLFTNGIRGDCDTS
jgi:putative transposase